jgi:hypothetical protein
MKTVKELQDSYTELLNEYDEAFKKYMAPLNKQLEDIRVTLKSEVGKTCPHLLTIDFKWSSSNGFGKTSEFVGKECVFCHFKSPFGHANNFSDPSGWRSQYDD